MANKRRRKRMNELFLESYIGVDKVCCRKFCISNGGVTEYITRLINLKLAPGRDEVLSRLVKYRNIRNRIAHESRALENIGDITKADLMWMNNFNRLLERQRDPYSNYLKKTHGARRKREGKRRFALVLILLLIAAAVAAYMYLK